MAEHRVMSKGLLRLAHYKSRKRNESQDDTEASWDEASDVPEAGGAEIRLCKAVARAGPGSLGTARADSA
jgi:hypothetical protein